MYKESQEEASWTTVKRKRQKKRDQGLEDLATNFTSTVIAPPSQTEGVLLQPTEDEPSDSSVRNKSPTQPSEPTEQTIPTVPNTHAAVKINHKESVPTVPQPSSEQEAMKTTPAIEVEASNDGWETVVGKRKKRREVKRSKKDSEIVAPSEVTPGQSFQNLEELNSTSGSSVLREKVPEKKPIKKKHKRKRKLNVPPEEEIVERIKEIIINFAPKGSKLTQSELCSRLESSTGCTWNRNFKPKHGPMRQFLEHKGFEVVNSQTNLLVGLPTQTSSNKVPPSPLSSASKSTTLPTSKSRSRRRNRRPKQKPPHKRKDPAYPDYLLKHSKTTCLMVLGGVVVLGCAAAAALLFGASSVR